MSRPRGQDPETLRAALIGWQHMLDQIDRRISELRSRLGSATAAALASGDGAGPKRVLSAAARRRIGRAQKKRWAAFRARKVKAVAKAPKRSLGAAKRQVREKSTPAAQPQALAAAAAASE